MEVEFHDFMKDLDLMLKQGAIDSDRLKRHTAAFVESCKNALIHSKPGAERQKVIDAMKEMSDATESKIKQIAQVRNITEEDIAKAKPLETQEEKEHKQRMRHMAEEVKEAFAEEVKEVYFQTLEKTKKGKSAPKSHLKRGVKSPRIKA